MRTPEDTPAIGLQCHISETSLRCNEVRDVVHYPAGSSLQKMGTLWSSRDGHGPQQYSGRFSLVSNKGTKVFIENIPHNITPST